MIREVNYHGKIPGAILFSEHCYILGLMQWHMRISQVVLAHWRHMASWRWINISIGRNSCALEVLGAGNGLSPVRYQNDTELLFTGPFGTNFEKTLIKWPLAIKKKSWNARSAKFRRLYWRVYTRVNAWYGLRGQSPGVCHGNETIYSPIQSDAINCQSNKNASWQNMNKFSYINRCIKFPGML